MNQSNTELKRRYKTPLVEGMPLPRGSGWTGNVAAALPDAPPDAQAARIEPAQPRCWLACGGTRLVYRELPPAQPTPTLPPLALTTPDSS